MPINVGLIRCIFYCVSAFIIAAPDLYPIGCMSVKWCHRLLVFELNHQSSHPKIRFVASLVLTRSLLRIR